MNHLPLEKDIERAVCTYAREHGFDAIKLASPAHAGLPDRMFMGPGRHVFFIEFKRSGMHMTPLQQRTANHLRQLGFRVYVIDEVQHGKNVVDRESSMCIMEWRI
jgi:Holliday junction resolvase